MRSGVRSMGHGEKLRSYFKGHGKPLRSFKSGNDMVCVVEGSSWLAREGCSTNSSWGRWAGGCFWPGWQCCQWTQSEMGRLEIILKAGPAELSGALHVPSEGRSCGFSGTVLPPRGHLAMSGDTFGCHSWGEGAMGIELEARGAADHPPGHTGAPRQIPSCQTQR